MTKTPTKPCTCGKQNFRASDHIEFCPDCAPNKSLAVYRAEQVRAQNPELPLLPAKSQPETPERLRARARQIRNDAQYADRGANHDAEMAEAARLEARANQLEEVAA